MIRWGAMLLGCALLAGAAPAPDVPAGDDFGAALAQAYATNPQLLAARQRLRQTDEDVPRALSGWRPRVVLDGSAGVSAVFDNTDPQHQPERRTPQDVQLSLTQPLYTGGRVRAQVGQARALVAAERAALQATEASVLLAAATAYADVARDQQQLGLQRNQAEVLARTLVASGQQQAAGALTEADVAQARARLADQRAVVAQVAATLAGSRARYEQAVGAPPGALAVPAPVLDLPPDLDAALARVGGNYDVLQSRAAQEASEQGIDIARAGLRPQLSFKVYGARVKETDVQLAHQRDNLAEATVQLTIPIYQGGEQAAEIRQSKEAAATSLLQANAVLRQARAQVQQAWAQLAGARTRMAEYRVAVAANAIADRGVRRQQSVGARTLIEVLNADQEKLAAEVSLIAAAHDALVAGLELAAATGRLSAAELRLDVAPYDPLRHYEETKGRWYGTTPAP